MSMKAIVGALRVVLGMDSAQFNKGATDAEKRATQMRKSFDKVGRGMSKFGKTMSVGVTAPLTALVAGARGATASLVALDNQAKSAGVGVQRFKELSLAVKGLGVDSDQLSDILKDVNDKMGDYFQTGAGPMADFFENVAPKVGLTAEAFKDLSSDQALLKYVKALQDANVSQSEMTFYMEALASDATRLLPALIDNGAAIEATAERARELGLTLNDDTIAAARKARGEFGLVADVMKTRLQAALLPLSEAFSRLGETVVPILVDLAGQAVEIVEAFNNLSPGMQELVVKAGLLAAAVGPVAIVLGEMLTAIKPIAKAVILMTSPIGLAVMAIGALSFVVWRNREAIAKWMREVWEKAKRIPGQLADAISSGVDAVTAAIADIWNAIQLEVKSWPGKMLDAGKNLVQGLIDGITGKKAEAASAGRNMARGMQDAFKAESGIESPSKVFMKFGAFLMEGLGIGIDRGVGRVSAKMTQAAQTISGKMSESANGMADMSSKVQELGDTSGGVFQRMGRWLVDIAKGTKTLRGTVADLLSTWGGNLMKSGIQGIGTALKGSMGSVGGSLVTGILGGLLGFANGGSFEVGGSGGIDSQLVAFRASPDERVTITKPGQALGEGGGRSGTIEMILRTDGSVIAEIARNETGMQIRQAVQVIDDALPARVQDIINEPYKDL